ncbi:hypothetical protein DL95DRAFT_61531 [Leptodontidium sp. 2 PMI_412]|nr:hypothetical protein DL95DRAFT_61531 [Leptodontidium sp. 2 PMI_412]
MSIEAVGVGCRPIDYNHSQKHCPNIPSMSRSLGTNPTLDYFWRPPSSPLTSSDCFGFSTRTWSQQSPDPPLRALEELHLEQTYLLDSLHAQSQTANQLTRKIPLLESKLQQPDLRSVHRKLRKQLSWLKSRLGQSSLQAQTISSRLDQLSSEIQVREQWTMMEQEQQRLEMYYRDQVLGYQQGLCDGLQMRMPLDSEQPAFQPRGYFPQMSWPQWQSEQSLNEYQITDNTSSYPSDSPEIWESKVAPEESPRYEYAVVKCNPHWLGLSRRSASVGNVDLGFLATNTPLVQGSTRKRHSFPSLPGCSGIWIPTAKEQADADAEGEARTEDLG